MFKVIISSCNEALLYPLFTQFPRPLFLPHLRQLCEKGKKSSKKSKKPKFEETELKSILKKNIEEERERVKAFRKSHGKRKIGEYTVDAVYGGMRGIKGLLCDTSSLDPELGITFRGLSIEMLQESLPKAEGGEQPLPEAVFWLMLTGEIPTEDQVKSLSMEWARRSVLPAHVCTFLDTISKHVHPMSQLSAATTILNTESVYLKAYNDRIMTKMDSWEYVYEDAMNLIAKQIVLAAKIYQNTYKGGASIGTLSTCRDWSHNFCLMLGLDNPEFFEVMRMYLSIHSDHESGNVSSHTVHLVNSALSDPYLSFAAGLNGLAGPLHGLANQEVLSFIEKMVKEIGETPSEDEVKAFCEETLSSGQVIPGYGHAVLRQTDPRFTCQYDFAQKHMAHDPLVKIVGLLYKVVPSILEGLGKVQNPWPNVDAHSGVLLKYYGICEPTYYTVLFGVSRSLGTMASIIWHRALGIPLERPKSVTTDQLMALADEQHGDADDE